MPARLSLFSLVAAGLVVAAQGPITSSLVTDPEFPNPLSTGLSTVFTTVTTTITTSPPPTTVTISLSATTTTFVSSPPPITTTTTIYSSSRLSLSSGYPTNAQETPMESGTLSPFPPHRGPGSIAQNPGALAGLIIGVCVLVSGLVALAWFTINRHRSLRERDNRASAQAPINALRYSTSPQGDAPPGHSRVIDDDIDIETQSYIGQEIRSSISHGMGASLSRMLSHGESPEPPVDYEAGYIVKEPTVASSNGHSSHGNGTTHNSSLTHVTGTRNPSPTLSRQTPNRTRSPIIPDRFATTTSARRMSRSEAPTRRGSVDDGSTISYHPHRVNSDPLLFHDAPQVMPPYTRRLSSEVPRPDMSQTPGPSILIYSPPPNLPSSLLRPPSAAMVHPRETPQSSGVYLNPLFAGGPIPSPASSSISVLPRRENLVVTNPNHSSSSPPSLSDGNDYSRQLTSGRDGADADSDPEINPIRELTQRRSTLG